MSVPAFGSGACQMRERPDERGSGLDRGDLDLGGVLTVTLTLAVSGLVLELHDRDLGALGGLDHLSSDLDLRKLARVGGHGGSIDQQQRRELDAVATVALHLVDDEDVADGHLRERSRTRWAHSLTFVRGGGHWQPAHSLRGDTSTVGAPRSQTTCTTAYEPNSLLAASGWPAPRGGPAGATMRGRLRRPRTAGAFTCATCVASVIGGGTAVFVGRSMELASAAGATTSGWTVIGAAAGSTEKAGDLAEREERRRDFWGVAT